MTGIRSRSLKTGRAVARLLGADANPHHLESELALTPEETRVLANVFEQVLRKMGLSDREDHATTLVAKKVIELAQEGERDERRLYSSCLAHFQNH